MKIDFVVGERYKNRKGWYEITRIDKDALHVVYEDDGSSAVLNRQIQANIISNIKQEESMAIPHSTPTLNQRYFETIGFLGRHCAIEAFVPVESLRGFEKNYSKRTGETPAENVTPGFFVHRDSPKWGVQLRVTLPDPTGEMLLDFGGLAPVQSPNPNELRVNNNMFCYALFEMGFLLGKGRHDIDKIRKSIPDQHKKDFEKGFNMGLSGSEERPFAGPQP